MELFYWKFVFVIGMDDLNDFFKFVCEVFKDEKRIWYYSGYFENLVVVIKYVKINKKEKWKKRIKKNILWLYILLPPYLNICPVWLF